ncbi:MAG: lysine transporter LysE, partial [Lachnospiraceae bacterium]|nr:lysine transporter LysE [Lachnospiraceae bacterium]
LILTVIGASGSYIWALFGSAFCSFFVRHTKTVNFVMALLLLYCAVSLFL